MLWMLSVIVIEPPVRAAWQHLEDNDAQCSGGQEQRQRVPRMGSLGAFRRCMRTTLRPYITKGLLCVVTHGPYNNQRIIRCWIRRVLHDLIYLDLGKCGTMVYYCHAGCLV